MASPGCRRWQHEGYRDPSNAPQARPKVLAAVPSKWHINCASHATGASPVEDELRFTSHCGAEK